MLRHPLDCNGWLRRRSHADPAVRAALGLGARSAPPAEAGWKRFYHCWDTGFGVASIGVGATLMPSVTRSLPETMTGSVPVSPLTISIIPLFWMPNWTGRSEERRVGKEGR